MKRPQTIINFLYQAYNKVNKSRYADQAWEGVNGILEAMHTVLNNINLMEDRKLDIWVNCENGGYKQNRDGQVWKEYLVHVEDDGKKLIGGVITCSACGTVADIWKFYDITLIMNIDKE